MRDYGTGQWAGGDPDCDHVRDVRKYADGCVGCGVPMQQRTPGCSNCERRHYMRRTHGTPADRNYDSPPEDHWERPRARDQVTQAAQVFADVCGKCGASRVDQQLGLEPTPDLYVASMVAVFRELRRVLAPYGTCWVNLGDSYAGSGPNTNAGFNERYGRPTGQFKQELAKLDVRGDTPAGLKPKDLVGIPWRVAFALQADGWYLRSDIVWSKPNPMPESVTDRPTKSHEYVFLLSKGPRYFFDQEAVREQQSDASLARYVYGFNQVGNGRPYKERYSKGEGADAGELSPNPSGRNIRSVWEIATQPYAEAHFATYPEALVGRCLKAGCPEWVCGSCGKPRERIVGRIDTGRTQKMADGWDTGDGGHGTVHRNGREKGAAGIPVLAPQTLGWSDCGHNNYRPGLVLDPFMGSGTTALVARRLGRHAIGVELNQGYAELCARRLQQLALPFEATL